MIFRIEQSWRSDSGNWEKKYYFFPFFSLLVIVLNIDCSNKSNTAFDMSMYRITWARAWNFGLDEPFIYIQKENRYRYFLQYISICMFIYMYNRIRYWKQTDEMHNEPSLLEIKSSVKLNKYPFNNRFTHHTYSKVFCFIERRREKMSRKGNTSTVSLLLVLLRAVCLLSTQRKMHLILRSVGLALKLVCQ